MDIVFNHDQQTNYQIAPLMFIVSLENAFKHGVESLTEDAYIHINIKTDADIIYFDIENNFEARESNETAGIGIQNLKQRLKLLYPNKHQIKIEVKDSVYKLELKIEMI